MRIKGGSTAMTDKEDATTNSGSRAESSIRRREESCKMYTTD
jgi:hypothetical protein